MAKFIPISPTSLSTMNTCPRQFEAKYITKEVVFKETPATIWGNRAHKALEDGIKSGATPPAEFSFLQPYIAKFRSFDGIVMSETELAIDRDGNPCSWRDRYLGGRADVVTIKGSHAFIGDLKTGKFKADNLQLSVLTKCLFANYPQVRTVTASLFYPHEHRLHTVNSKRDTVKYTELEADIAHYEAVLEQDKFLPKPNGLCRAWCDVTSCPHNGRK